MATITESVEQLVTKKRLIKLGAMQQLLSGHRRLPGYSQKWKPRRLGELGVWKGGMTPSMANARYWLGGTIPWISSGDVKGARLSATAFSITPLAVTDGTTNLLPSNSVIIVTRSGILRKHLPVAVSKIPMAINQDVKALIPDDDVSSDFILHLLMVNGERILANCLKSGTTVESIEFGWLKNFSIQLPEFLEQVAIAEVLNRMDAEIDALERRSDKTRRLKEGMMQNLLTGKIRLVSARVDHSLG